jgi:hypothetical protein
LNGVFSSANQEWIASNLDMYLSIGQAGSVDAETSVQNPDQTTQVRPLANEIDLFCNGANASSPDGLSASLLVKGLQMYMAANGGELGKMFQTYDDLGNPTGDNLQNIGVYLTGYNAYYDLSKAEALFNAFMPTIAGMLDQNGYDVSSWSVPLQGHYAIDGDLKTKYTNDIFPMLGQYLPQIGTMEVAMLEMAYEANPSDFVVTNDNGHYTFTADTTNVAHLYSNVESVLNSLGVDVLITKQDLPMLSEDLTVEGALKWVKAVTDSMTINKLKVTFDYTATVFNKVDVDIDVVWDEAKIKADLAAMGDEASWPLAFKLATSASAKTGDEAKITLPDFAGYTDFVMPPKKAAA